MDPVPAKDSSPEKFLSEKNNLSASRYDKILYRREGGMGPRGRNLAYQPRSAPELRKLQSLLSSHVHPPSAISLLVSLSLVSATSCKITPP